jgi:hypothetical protein
MVDIINNGASDSVSNALAELKNKLDRISTDISKFNSDKIAQYKNASNDSSKVDVCLLFDITKSMEPYINAVAKNISRIGNEILSAKLGIEACVLGVGEHNHFENDAISKSKMLGDYGQNNVLTASVVELKNQIDNVVVYNQPNNSYDEAYECVAADISNKIAQRIAPGRKHVVVFFGDSFAHGTPKSSELCPFERSNEQIEHMVQIADMSYFVGCDESRIFEKYTYGPVKSSNKSAYVSFVESADVISELIIGMVKKQQNRAVFAEYVNQLAPSKAAKVAGLLR